LFPACLQVAALGRRDVTNRGFDRFVARQCASGGDWRRDSAGPRWYDARAGIGRKFQKPAVFVMNRGEMVSSGAHTTMEQDGIREMIAV
jgi:hypothetical protein